MGVRDVTTVFMILNCVFDVFKLKSESTGIGYSVYGVVAVVCSWLALVDLRYMDSHCRFLAVLFLLFVYVI